MLRDDRHLRRPPLLEPAQAPPFEPEDPFVALRDDRRLTQRVPQTAEHLFVVHTLSVAQADQAFDVASSTARLEERTEAEVAHRRELQAFVTGLFDYFEF